MTSIIVVLGLTLLVTVLWDAFEAIFLPRGVTRYLGLARVFLRFTWRLQSAVARWMPDDRRRETYLSIFGPLSLLQLLGMWAAGLVAGFAMLHWGLGTPLNVAPGSVPFSTYLYLSGTTFFTLGLGDVTPLGPPGRALVAVEAGVGFGFLTAVISYLPVLYQAFSRREVSISLLDARAGSPPSAGELLRRHGADMPELDRLLYDWERWSAELLESHLSYPVLAYFRSQHPRQSWLAALTAILDTCALVMAGVDGGATRQAQLTFAMARHAVVDLAQVFLRAPLALATDRLPPASVTGLRAMLADAGVTLPEGVAAERHLCELRQMYEPYVQALSAYLLMPLPPWFRTTVMPDRWQASAWGGKIITDKAIPTHLRGHRGGWC
jgi:hypothetical protein